MQSTAKMQRERMQPMGLLYDRTPEGDLTRFTFFNASASFVPRIGTYSVTPSSVLEFPREEKAAKFLFQFDKNGVSGLKVFNGAGHCFSELSGASCPDYERELILNEKEEIFAMRMGTENDCVQAVHFLLCTDLGKRVHHPANNFNV